jgi:SPP1 family predicted phage head-tail adaptor
MPENYNLDHRITINRLVPGANSYNEQIETFAVFTSLWASRQDATAGELWRAAEVGAQIDCHFVVRFSPEAATITAKDTITIEGGKTYNITGVRELARNEWLEIHAVTRPDK